MAPVGRDVIDLEAMSAAGSNRGQSPDVGGDRGGRHRRAIDVNFVSGQWETTQRGPRHLQLRLIMPGAVQVERRKDKRRSRHRQGRIYCVALGEQIKAGSASDETGPD